MRSTLLCSFLFLLRNCVVIQVWNDPPPRRNKRLPAARIFISTIATAPRSTILYSDGWKLMDFWGRSISMKDLACFWAGFKNFEEEPYFVKSAAKNIVGRTVVTWIILWGFFLNFTKQLLIVEIFAPAHNIFSVRMCTEIKFEVRLYLRNEISSYAKKFCTKEIAHVAIRQELFYFWLNIKMCSFGVRFSCSSPFKNANTREPLKYFIFKSLNWIEGISIDTNLSADLDAKKNVFLVKLARIVRRRKVVCRGVR